MNDDLKALEKNPLFQMSLGSKELFHSNFLAWILNEDKNFSKEFISQLTGINNIKSFTSPSREKMNIDLQFSLIFNDDSEQLIVIENKVKSLPNRKQLEKYKKKIEGIITKQRKKKGNKDKKILDPKFYLLSLIEPAFPLDKEWKFISYSALADALKKTLEKKSIPDGENILKVSNVITSYIIFAKSLDKLFVGKSIDFEKDEFDFNEKDVIKPYKDLRIHDLFLKLTYQQIAEEIKNKVENEFSELEVSSDWNEFKECEGGLFIGTGFTRGTSIIEFKYNLKKLDNSDNPLIVVLGIQLQGNMFKYIIELSGKSTASYPKKKIQTITYKIANKLFDDKKWVRSSREFLNNLPKSIFINDKSKIGKGRSKHDEDNYNEFCSYNDIFLYKYDIISEKAKISDLISLFEKILKYILDNKEEFESLAKQNIKNLKT